MNPSFDYERPNATTPPRRTKHGGTNGRVARKLGGMFVGAALLLQASSFSAPAGAATRDARPATSTPPLTINDSAVGPLTDDFNPYLDPGNPGVSEIYEPLLIWDHATGRSYDWLASRYRWSDGYRKLVITLRNATWSNGTPFTSADVVLTFSLLKRDPGLNVNDITFSTVKALGPHQVAFTFASPAFWEFYYITSELIVPQTVWSHVPDPTKFTDTKPVGTGPYVLSKWSNEFVTLVVNPHYWGLKPHVPRLVYEAEDSTTTCGVALETGSLQWANCVWPHYKQLFVAKNPAENVAWLPSFGDEAIYPNLQKYPMNLLPLREAMSLVINRQVVSTEGESGAAPPVTSPTGLLPQDAAYLDPTFKTLRYKVDVPKAKQILRSGGFKFGKGGQLISPKGTPVAFSILNLGGNSNFAGDVQVIINDLKNIGISASDDAVASPTYFADLATGDFKIAFYFSSQASVDPYSLYSPILNTQLLKPAGQSSAGDNERWTNPLSDRYLNDYRNATTTGARLQALYGLEKIMVNDVPIIPVVHNVWNAVYTSKYYVGWPTKANPYAIPDSLLSEGELTLLHLHPRA